MDNDNNQLTKTPTIPTVSSQPPVGPTPVGKNNKTKFAVIAAAVFILMMQVAVVIYLNSSRSGTEQLSSESSIEDKGENEVYTNKIHGFSIEYPKSFLIQENPQPQKQSQILTISGTENILEEGGSLHISLSIGKKSSSDTAYGSYIWTKEVLDSLLTVPAGGTVEKEFDLLHRKEDFVIDGMPWVAYEVRPKVSGVGIFPSYNLVMEKNDSAYLFSVHTFNKGQSQTIPSDNPTVKMIISSFKFE